MCVFFHFGISHKIVLCVVVNVPAGENTSDAKDEKVSQSHLYIYVGVSVYVGRMCGNNR